MQLFADSQPRVLILNGGSSSGKSTLARELQNVLPGTWLRLGVDTLIDACPARLFAADGLELADDGAVRVGPTFALVEQLWMAGVARMAELGAQIMIEDNFVSGPGGQDRWRTALQAVPVGWIGVHCPPEEASRRELARGDRIVGMASQQATLVHEGIDYDLEVNTVEHDISNNAERIRQRFYR